MTHEIVREHESLRFRLRSATESAYQKNRPPLDTDVPVILSISIKRGWGDSGMVGFRSRLMSGDDGQAHVCEWYWAKGASMTWHSHDSEEIIECLTGSFILYTGDETCVIEKGGKAVIPAGVAHAGMSIEESHIRTTFHPPLWLEPHSSTE